MFMVLISELRVPLTSYIVKVSCCPGLCDGLDSEHWDNEDYRETARIQGCTWASGKASTRMGTGAAVGLGLDGIATVGLDSMCFIYLLDANPE